MKPMVCTIWALSALLVVVSMDAVPDAPAVNTHTTGFRAPCFSECLDSFCQQPSICDFSSASFSVHIHSIASVRGYKPNRASDWTVLIGQAGDPSPPVL